MEQHEQAVIQQIMQIVMNKVNQVQNPVKNDSDEELEVKELPQSQKSWLEEDEEEDKNTTNSQEDEFYVDEERIKKAKTGGRLMQRIKNKILSKYRKQREDRDKRLRLAEEQEDSNYYYDNAIVEKKRKPYDSDDDFISYVK